MAPLNVFYGTEKLSSSNLPPVNKCATQATPKAATLGNLIIYVKEVLTFL
jgi:hypothetical protein